MIIKVLNNRNKKYINVTGAGDMYEKIPAKRI